MDFDDFECILFQKWDPNGSQNPSRNWIRKGMPLESDFYDIMVDFGPQNGVQNLLKTQKHHKPKKSKNQVIKNIEKLKYPGSKMNPGGE